MKKKTIIFGAPYEMKEEFIKNLEFLGFNVIDVSYPHDYKYKNFIEKATNFIHKSLQGHLGYKKKLRFTPYKEQFEKKIFELPEKADFALFIRPDIFTEDFVQLVTNNVEKSVAYQWDGMHIFPDVKKYVHFFDRFFVFDPKDISPQKKLLPITNFFFDYNLNNVPSEKENKEDNIYFLGSYFKKRMQQIVKISEIIAKTHFKNNIYIRIHKKNIKPKYKELNINILENWVSFSENIKKMKQATVLLDFLNGKHNGLSFRTFEAIGYRKKLITNNIDIKKYDFYHPNNFFIWENDNFENLEEFLNLPYVDLPESLWKKYSFSNWINYILDIEPHQKITLPKAEN